MAATVVEVEAEAKTIGEMAVSLHHRRLLPQILRHRSVSVLQ